MSRSIDLSLIRTQYIDIIRSLRNTGIKLSDRRAVKLQNLIAASAFISKKKEASISDLWVLRYIWDTEEQLEILAGLINNVIEKDNSESHHPQAFSNKAPNAEELMSELNGLSNKWSEESISCEEQNIIKDKLRFLQSRCDWIKNHEQKQYLQNEVDKLWKQILQTI
jgi:MoxR-like ATPase